MKTCQRCNRNLEEIEFSFVSKEKSKRRNTCKKCVSETYKEWVKRNPEKVKETWRRASNKHHKKYSEFKNLKRRILNVGITEDEYVAMLSRQNGKCKICNVAEIDSPKHRLNIDHCHKSGVVRGLLCSKCNTALGLMDDDTERLKSAINYLNIGEGSATGRVS